MITKYLFGITIRWFAIGSVFFFYCSQLQTHSWPAIFLTKDLTKWLHWTLPLSQSAAAVTPESNERPFVIIKWIDQRSLHVQKCNDTANGIVPLLPSRCYNYIVKGHGELTAMGRFSTVDCVSNVVQPQYPWKKLRTLSIYNGVIFLFFIFWNVFNEKQKQSIYVSADWNWWQQMVSGVLKSGKWVQW